MDSLRVGIVQMTSGDDIRTNIDLTREHYRRAASLGVDVVTFPENSLFSRRTHADAPVAPTTDHLAELDQMVLDAGAPLLLTTAMPARDGRFANATLLCEPGRPTRVVYEKMHLFDVRLKDQPPVRESQYFRPGIAPAVIELKGWRIGLAICYDVRFAELFLTYAQAADVIMVPSAFLTITGRAHWHILLRARAIEAQAYVVAPAQVGGASRCYGHGLVVSPWGDVLVDMDQEVGVRVVDLRREDINKMREQIPVADHRRPC